MPDNRMLREQLIIYFGPEPWHGLWRNRHQLMSRFARHNTVWYVEPPTILRHLFSGRKHRTRLTSQDPSGVRVFHSPWWLPIIGRPPFARITLGIYFFVLGMLTRGHGSRPIVWVSRPDMLPTAKRFSDALVIYHVVDEYSGYGTASLQRRKKIISTECDLLRLVDAAIVVTPSLQKSKSPYNASTFLVANAVDYEAYAKPPGSVPVEIERLPRPVIGYSGLIASRLDLKMLAQAAAMRTNWSFVFVGAVNDTQCETEMASLKQLGNVHFLGEQTVKDIPDYVKQFDVCTIPYLTNLRAAHASPLKLYEYTAAGKPVVATNFAAAQEFGGHIELCDDVESFVQACERMLSLGPDSATIESNRQFASQNTWEDRVEQISNIIASLK